MEKAEGIFFHNFPQIQTEKVTLLLKKLYLMNFSMKNGKKPEKQCPAKGNVVQEAGDLAASSWQRTRHAGLCRGPSCWQESQPDPSGEVLVGPH